MRYYPIFLDLTGKTCLVAGAGSVGLRKIKTIMTCSPAKIIVVDPYVKNLEISENAGIIMHLQEEFKPVHLLGCHLVFACTSDPGINDQIVQTCRERNIWCNLAERPEQGDFILPGVFSRQDLIFAVSTCGCSPALTARIKKDLQGIYGPEYALLTRLLAGVRKIILPLNLTQEQNRVYFRKIVDSRVLDLLKSGRKQELTALLQDILPAETHNRIKELIDADL